MVLAQWMENFENYPKRRKKVRNQQKGRFQGKKKKKKELLLSVARGRNFL